MFISDRTRISFIGGRHLNFLSPFRFYSFSLREIQSSLGGYALIAPTLGMPVVFIQNRTVSLSLASLHIFTSIPYFC